MGGDKKHISKVKDQITYRPELSNASNWKRPKTNDRKKNQKEISDVIHLVVPGKHRKKKGWRDSKSKGREKVPESHQTPLGSQVKTQETKKRQEQKKKKSRLESSAQAGFPLQPKEESGFKWGEDGV